MVSSALKPYYQKKTISKDEYTTINRDISRKLYEQIVDFEALGVEGRATWEKIAGDEVERAVAKIQNRLRSEKFPGGEMVRVAS